MKNTDLAQGYRDAVAQWRIIGHTVMAVEPGCPETPHRTSECLCRIFSSRVAAQNYINRFEREVLNYGIQDR